MANRERPRITRWVRPARGFNMVIALVVLGFFGYSCIISFTHDQVASAVGSLVGMSMATFVLVQLIRAGRRSAPKEI